MTQHLRYKALLGRVQADVAVALAAADVSAANLAVAVEAV